MRIDVVLRYVGIVMLFIAAFMLVSAGISCVSGMDSAFYPLLLSALLTILLGAFPLIFVGRSDQISTKEGFCIVVGSWLVACVVGMFPYLIWGGEFSLENPVLQIEDLPGIGLMPLGILAQPETQLLDHPKHRILARLQEGILTQQRHVGLVLLQTGDTGLYVELLGSKGRGQQQSGQRQAQSANIHLHHLHHFMKKSCIRPKISRRPNSIRKLKKNFTAEGIAA